MMKIKGKLEDNLEFLEFIGFLGLMVFLAFKVYSLVSHFSQEFQMETAFVLN